MEDKPSPEEIAFARMRRTLSDELAPYFVQRIHTAGFHAFNIPGSIDTLDGGLRRQNTLYGQSFIFPAHIETSDGATHEVQLLIQHTEKWYAAVTVLTDDGGPEQTVIIQHDVLGAIPKLKKMIDDAISKIRHA